MLIICIHPRSISQKIRKICGLKLYHLNYSFDAFNRRLWVNNTMSIRSTGMYFISKRPQQKVLTEYLLKGFTPLWMKWYCFWGWIPYNELKFFEWNDTSWINLLCSSVAYVWKLFGVPSYLQHISKASIFLLIRLYVLSIAVNIVRFNRYLNWTDIHKFDNKLMVKCDY